MRTTDYSTEITNQLAVQGKSHEEQLHAIQQAVSENLHELKTPVAIIKGYLEIIDTLNEKPNNRNDHEKEYYYFNKIKMQLCELEAIVTCLSQASKLIETNRHYNFTPIPLNRFIIAIINQFEILYSKKQINIDYDLPDETLLCELDPEQFRHVLQNIIFNAIKYTPEKGTIRIKLKEEWKNGQSEILICISDNGRNLSSEECIHIFNRYYTAEKNTGHFKQSSGIGLNLSKKIINGHKGSLWAKSPQESGENGVSIYISLPKTQSQS